VSIALPASSKNANHGIMRTAVNFVQPISVDNCVRLATQTFPGAVRRKQIDAPSSRGRLKFVSVSVVLQPCGVERGLFPCRDPGMAVMLFQFVFVVFFDGAPE